MSGTAAELQRTTPVGDNGVNGLSLSTPPLAQLTLHSVIAVWFDTPNQPGTGCTDTSGVNTYRLVGHITAPDGLSAMWRYQCDNNLSTATGVVVSCTVGASVHGKNIEAIEIGGVTNTGEIGSNFQPVVNPGGADNAITLSIAQSASGNSWIDAHIAAVSGTAAVVPSPGTNFTAYTGFPVGSGFSKSMFESRRSTTPGVQTANGTDSSSGNATTFLLGLVVYDEVSSGSGVAMPPMAGNLGTKRGTRGAQFA